MLLAIAAAAGTIGVFPGIIFELPVLMLIGLVATFAITWIYLFRQCRADLHFDRQLTLASKFWVGQGDNRHLSAGGRR